MKILLTGSTGFVGKNLTKFLKGSNYEISTVNRGGGDYDWGNIFKVGIPKSIDAIIHLAGKAHDLKGICEPNEYFAVNTDLTVKLFQEFLVSDAKLFFYFSSVKASADSLVGVLNEDYVSSPSTIYGISKLQAEIKIRGLFDDYQKQCEIGDFKLENKFLYILRPCMIHGPYNKGNLNVLFALIRRGIPYPLGVFDNRRSFLSIENLGFIINEILIKPIESGIYQLADNDSISTVDIIKLMGESIGAKPSIWYIPKLVVNVCAKIGDLLRLPFNTHSLIKLTESYCVSNGKIIAAIGKPLPLSLEDGLKLSFISMSKAVKQN